ncbi:MaoC/PaaZ C-terminal domain-containing protein [Undibacter mobilis]|uniref:3-alpha,7-alpha, 12-alpha-trihydroxy-5-beta-cholest-24-enoyl-CoA hydratase n=1 Tax=Undibacter mobilis TaxID=2292256 RepID=A0A371B8G6_9BRAD|nr:MaoC/PaaZ C-terminal domain-containing protein [Undibacter mobilis]RDV03860.1 3-alpha,7-alpha,12-alpha-trihydroxy-5-beta-cholest-24-enoyl-CoA hydratase [Undibacter mobilis]
MPLNAEKLLAAQLPAVEHAYGPKDCILYALGVGLGYDPTSEDELAFVYEKNLKVLPTFPVVLGLDYSWMLRPEFGLTWSHIVHGEETIVLHAPIPSHGTVIGQERVVDVIDKGEGKGALLYHDRTVVDKATGTLLATLKQTTFCRADGGFSDNSGSVRRDTPAPHPIPDRAPDLVCDLPTRPEMALLYRLSGDSNPLHAEPTFAREAGFPRPILHGLATMGVVGHALLKTVGDYDPARLSTMAVRFSAPVFPGETIRTEIWRDGSVVAFRARVKERDVIAINNGRAEIKE